MYFSASFEGINGSLIGIGGKSPLLACAVPAIRSTVMIAKYRITIFSTLFFAQQAVCFDSLDLDHHL
jgi:hypothetical protein